MGPVVYIVGVLTALLCAVLLLRGRRRLAGRRRRDLVGAADAGVVAVQAAQRVIGREEPAVGQPPVESDFERVVLALRLRRLEWSSLARGGHQLRNALAGQNGHGRP